MSRLTDHMETRPRWFRPAKPASARASLTVKFSPCMSFWPIITVAPIRCQICCALSLMPYSRVQGGELPVRGVQRGLGQLPPWCCPGRAAR